MSIVDTNTAPLPPGVAPLDIAMRVTPLAQADTFLGAGRDYGPLWVYGGHLLGQGLAAGLATVPDDKLAHSLHAYFLKTGKPGEPIRYAVDRLRDGRNYQLRSIRAEQEGETLLIMTASFKAMEPGDEHQTPAPDVPHARSLRAARIEAGAPALEMPFAAPFGIEQEACDDWSPRGPHGQDPAIRTWMRAPISAGANARDRQCALAYLSDSTLMFNALRPYGNAFATHRATSLDHSLWFHREADPADWLLFDQRSPTAADSRGLNLGAMFDGKGRLVLSAAQESMLRRL
ncbi:MAG: thioesterase family protein [Pseudomonadales bacterium]|nr:thioesterase family protein [Pseudomonadales bacterium]MCP5184930.1 thioesterase family protein [Pseudomonadales bacterium]